MMKARDLKNSILQLAVEGKLVPQNPNDEPASMLLERIREQKRQLIAEGKAKFPRGGESVIFIGSDGLPYEKRVDAKGRESEPICIADEVPFEIPKSWKWVRLENVCQKIVDCPHSTPQYLTAETGYVAIDTNCIDDDWHLTGTRNLSKESYEIRVSRYVPQVGDLIFTREGSIGRSLIINRNRVCLGQRVMLMSTFQDALMSTYCQLVLSSPYAWTLYKAAHVGTGVKHINVVMVKALLVPLPPLAEQRRIVAKVSELMPLVKGYGELEEEREELDTKLPEALRKSVLQQAVEGRLVPQDPSDEPASILLNRIRAARRELVADGKLKFPRGGESVIFRGSDGRRYEKRVDKNGRESEPVCIEDEIPFEIPESWEWARFTELVPVQYGFPADSQLFDKDAPIGLIRIRDVNSGDLVHTATGYRGEYPSECLIHAGDDLIGMDGEFACHRWKGPEALLNQRICCLRYLPEGLSSDFVSYAVNWYLEQIWKTTSKTTVKHLSAKALDAMLFAVPPLSEQERIVAKVKQLESITNR